MLFRYLSASSTKVVGLKAHFVSDKSSKIYLLTAQLRSKINNLKVIFALEFQSQSAEAGSESIYCFQWEGNK